MSGDEATAGETNPQSLAAQDTFDRTNRAVSSSTEAASGDAVSPALELVAAGTAEAAGTNFFYSLVRYLAAALNVRYAFVTRIVDRQQTEVRTLAFWKGDGFRENFTYRLAGTPCQEPVAGALCYYERGVTEQFPEDKGLKKMGVEGYAGLPVRDSRGAIVGHLVIMHDAPLQCGSNCLSVLQIFAARAGSELERRLAEQAARHSLDRLSLLLTIDNAILGGRTVEAVAGVALHGLCRLVHCDDVLLVLFGIPVFAYTVDGRALAEEPVPLPGKLLPDDVELEMLFGDTTWQLAPGDPRQQKLAALLLRQPGSSLLAPLVVQGEQIGTLVVARDAEAPFEDDQVRITGTVAGQMAIAITQARMSVETRRRLGELTALHDVAQAFGAMSNVEDTFNLLAGRLVRLVGAEYCLFALVDFDSGRVHVQNPQYGLDEAHLQLFEELLNSYEGLRALQEQPVYMVNSSDELPAHFGRFINAVGLESVLGVAMFVEGKRIGTVLLGNKPEGFTDDDARLLGVLANQAGAVIHNARLFAAAHRQLRELRVLHATAVATAEARDEDQLIARVTDIVGESFYLDCFGVLLLDESQSYLRAHPSFRGVVEEARRAQVPLDQSVSGRVVLTGRPLRVGDISTLSRYYQANPLTRSELCVPLKIGDRTLGVIDAESHQAHAFSEEDERLLVTMAGQLASAIDRLRTRAAEQHRARQLATIYDATRRIFSILDLDELLQTVVDLLVEKMGFYNAAISFVEEDQLLFRAGAGDYRRNDARETPVPLPLGAGISGRVALTGQPLLVTDVANFPGYAHFPDLLETRCELGVPLHAHGKVAGVLNVKSREVGGITQEDAAMIEILGDRISAAIENAMLVRDLQTSLHQEQETRAQLVQAGKLSAMGRLVASVTHELNNPLQAIQSALYLVQREQILSPQGERDLDVALQEIGRMATLIRQLRQTYRPTRQTDFERTDLNALIRETGQLLDTHLRHQEITFQFEPDETVPPVSLLPDQIKQVLLNLCLNAAEAMPEGGVLEVQTDHLPEEAMVLLSVTDTGTGIEPEDLPNVFDPFFTRKEHGTGLGLAISYDIIRQHEGAIRVESSLGQGTTFTICLPAGSE